MVHSVGLFFYCSRISAQQHSSEKDYGNEKEAGLGVKRAIEEGIVKREDLVIVSKLWCTFHEKERVEPIVRRQLEWWGIEYVFFFFAKPTFFNPAHFLNCIFPQLLRCVLHPLPGCPRVPGPRRITPRWVAERQR